MFDDGRLVFVDQNDTQLIIMSTKISLRMARLSYSDLIPFAKKKLF